MGASTKWRMVSAVIKAIEDDANGKHGELLMPSGYEAMLRLCDALEGIGNVKSILGLHMHNTCCIEHASA